ncbi:MAG TPA: TfoX/Sxy family protein [Opitutaceae bacterium]|nr:TfoX/Sxy family protein [Opitutaceae bacterium]
MPRKPERILPFRDTPDVRESFGAMLNLGPKSSAWLIEAGIKSMDEVRRLGPIEVCRQLRARGHPVSVVMAYALEGALAGCHWNAIPWETKDELRLRFAKMKAAEA